MFQRSVRNQKSDYGFSTPLGPLPMHRCQWHSDTDPRIETCIAPSEPTKHFYAKMKISLHPSKVQNQNIQYTSKPRYLEEIRFLKVKSVT
jgi:hypothetical protein